MDVNANQIGIIHNWNHPARSPFADKARKPQKPYQMNRVLEIPKPIIPTNYSRDEAVAKNNSKNVEKFEKKSELRKY